MKMEDTEALGR